MGCTRHFITGNMFDVSSPKLQSCKHQLVYPVRHDRFYHQFMEQFYGAILKVHNCCKEIYGLHTLLPEQKASLEIVSMFSKAAGILQGPLNGLNLLVGVGSETLVLHMEAEDE